MTLPNHFWKSVGDRHPSWEPWFTIKYDRSRFPVRQKRPDGTWGCRGCGRPIGKGCQTWCGPACHDVFDPRNVIQNVKQRDKHLCQGCGVNIQAERNARAQKRALLPWSKRNSIPHIVENFDHIISFSEGGLTVLENMRTLCDPCHKNRTKYWHGERADNRKGQPRLALVTP